MSIHEFSQLSGVETSTLRYWDEIGIFSPANRNPENNYRYYSPTQLLALNFVTTLSDLQFPLKVIAQLRKERSPNQLLDLLEKQELAMDMEMRDLQIRYSIIHARRKLISIGIIADENVISIEHLDERTLSLWPRNEYMDDDTFINPFAKHVSKPHEHGINLSFPKGSYYDSFSGFTTSTDKPDHFFTVDPVGAHYVNAGEYMVGYARGDYCDLGDLPERMSAYAEKNSITTCGPVYIIHLHEEVCSDDPSRYLAQASVATKTADK